ncbi:MAG: hypothetical protein LIO57_07080 [Oscillospiraceae bacterium]|nr:hypothetical protein [Oscillospiraceae bacterium]
MSKIRIGVEIGERAVSVAVMRGGQCRAASVPLPQCAEGERGKAAAAALRQACLECGVKRGDAALALPWDAVEYRCCARPDMSEARIRSGLEGEFSDFGGEKLCDYEILGERGGTLELEAACVSRRGLDSYADVLSAAGLRLTAAVPAETAYGALTGGEECCVLAFGQREARLTVYSGGTAVFRRVIGGAEEHGEAAAAVCKALNFYRYNAGTAALPRVYVCGEGADREAQINSLRETLQTEVTDGGELPALAFLHITETGALAAVGAALGGGEARRTREKRTISFCPRQRRRADTLKTAALVLAIIAAAALFGKTAVADRLADLAQARSAVTAAQTELAALKASCADYDAVLERYRRNFYDGLDNRTVDRLEVMALVEEQIFPVCRVSNLSVDGQTLNLILADMDLAGSAELVERLMSQDIVQNVEVYSVGYQNGDMLTTMTVTLCAVDET